MLNRGRLIRDGVDGTEDAHDFLYLMWAALLNSPPRAVDQPYYSGTSIVILALGPGDAVGISQSLAMVRSAGHIQVRNANAGLETYSLDLSIPVARDCVSTRADEWRTTWVHGS